MKTKCEVYSRVVGYLRPVDSWNEGKQSEFKDRKLFDVGKSPSSKNKNSEIEETEVEGNKEKMKKLDAPIRVTS